MPSDRSYFAGSPGEGRTHEGQTRRGRDVPRSPVSAAASSAEMWIICPLTAKQLTPLENMSPDAAKNPPPAISSY